MYCIVPHIVSLLPLALLESDCSSKPFSPLQAADLHGVAAHERCNKKGLYTLATVIVDYRGYRVVCQSVIPGNKLEHSGMQHPVCAYQCGTCLLFIVYCLLFVSMPRALNGFARSHHLGVLDSSFLSLLPLQVSCNGSTMQLLFTAP